MLKYVLRFVRRRKSSALRPIEIGRKLLKAIDVVDTDPEGRRIGPTTCRHAQISTEKPRQRKSLIDELSAAAIVHP